MTGIRSRSGSSARMIAPAFGIAEAGSDSAGGSRHMVSLMSAPSLACRLAMTRG